MFKKWNIIDLSDRFSPNRTSFIGAMLCLIALMFLMMFFIFSFHLSLSDYVPPLMELQKERLIPFYLIGLTLLPLGLATLSLGLSLHSQDIAGNSDNKVQSIANANFLRVIGQLEDRRIELASPQIRVENTEDGLQVWETTKLYTIRPINTWKCLTYIREAEELMKFSNIEKPYIDRLVNLFIKYIETISHTSHDFTNEEMSHVLSMYKHIFEIKNINRDHRTKANEILKNLFGEETNRRIGLRYINSKLNRLKEYINQSENNKTQPFFISGNGGIVPRI